MSFVLLCVIFTFAGITALTQKSMALDTELNQLKDMFSIDESKMSRCGILQWMNQESHQNLITLHCIEHFFMKCALLLRDTNDAYKMGDGDRVTVNAKYQMLLSRVGNHTKYQLWLFRYLANCLTLFKHQEWLMNTNGTALQTCAVVLVIIYLMTIWWNY